VWLSRSRQAIYFLFSVLFHFFTGFLGRLAGFSADPSGLSSDSAARPKRQLGSDPHGAQTTFVRCLTSTIVSSFSEGLCWHSRVDLRIGFGFFEKNRMRFVPYSKKPLSYGYLSLTCQPSGGILKDPKE
jgi:hypothetical protein